MANVFSGLTPDRIVLLEQTDKTAALKTLIARLAETGAIPDAETLEREVFERERIMSTSIGLGVAVPHARLEGVDEIVMALGIAPEGIDFDAFDGQPIRIIILIAAPTGTQREYLGILAKIALLLKNEQFRQRIIAAATPDDMYQIIKEY